MIGKTLGHYKVLDEIGAGGMGVVYRAHDTRLERDVALKVLPAGLLLEPAARKRFRTEALALARLNHPNICSVFDFDTQDDTDFLVMEFVPGTSFDVKLSSGSLPLHEVPRLGAQLAAGLEAAHAQGVLHRDLKPGNLRVTPDGRLKILDFGLAKLFHPDASPEVTLSASETSSFSGTAPYMAPEQLRGEPLDPRADIYSAGAVLYQFAAGRRPFSERQLAKLIDAVLNQTLLPPSHFNRRISPALDSIILKTMDRRPERRYQSARELQIDLERLASDQPLAGSDRPRFSRTAITVTAAILVVGVAFGSYLARRANFFRRPPAADSKRVAPVPSRRTVAVIGFKNLSPQPDSAWLSTALSEMLTTELAAGESLRTVSSENISRMKTDLSLSDMETYAPDTLRRIRTISGSEAVIVGSYVVLPGSSGGKIRVNLHVQDTTSGENLVTVSETGNQDDLLEIVARTGSRLRSYFGVSALTSADAGFVRASFPASSSAARLYSQGLERLRYFDSVAARDLLEKAAAAEPSNAMIHSALAVAWGQLGYDEHARESAKRALDLSSGLSREDRLTIEARYRESIHEYDRVSDIYKTLHEFFPDNPDYFLRLASAQSAARKPDDAFATLDQFRTSFPAAKDDPNADLIEASCSDRISDFKREQAAAARAAEKGRQRGERVLVARALLLEGWAWKNLGDPAKAIAVTLEAKSTFETIGDRAGIARSLHNLGNVAQGTGKPDEAQKYFEQAVAIRLQIQDNVGLARAYNNLALIRESRGDYKGAIALHQESLSIARKVGDKNAAANSLGNLANIYGNLGRTPEARKLYEESLAMHREIGDKLGIAAALANLGNLLSQEGDPENAKRDLEESAAISEQINAQSSLPVVRIMLGNLYFDQSDLPSARKNYQLAADLSLKNGDRVNAADSQADLAIIDRLEGDFASSRVHSDAALSDAREGGDASILASVSLSHATLLLVTGDIAGARKLSEEILATLQKSDDKRTTARAMLNLGELDLLQGDFAAAGRNFDQSLAIQKSLKDPAAVAETQYYIARLAIEQHQPARAISLARQAAADLHAHKNRSGEAWANLFLASALMNQSASLANLAEAQKALAAANAIIDKTPTMDLRMTAAPLLARSRAASGSPADAQKSLETAIAELSAKSSFDVQLDARLVLAVLQLKSGNPAANAALADVEKQATPHGLFLIARKAKSASAN